MRVLKMAMLLLWAGSGYANPETTVDLPGGATMEMVWIEPGTFMMGSPDSDSLAKEDDNEKPQHRVTISKGYYLGKYEMTQGQWQAVMGTKPWSSDGYVRSGQMNPAVDISWDNIQVLVHKLNQAAGDSLYRLPTEAEWEYACRAGTSTRYSFGDDENLVGDYAVYYENAWGVGEEYVHAVGTKKPNPWGLFDMHGNVLEWVQDWYDLYPVNSQTDPTGPPSGLGRVIRSGSAYMSVQSALRYYFSPTGRGLIGTRLLKMGPAPTSVTPQSWGEVKGEPR